MAERNLEPVRAQRWIGPAVLLLLLLSSLAVVGTTGPSGVAHPATVPLPGAALPGGLRTAVVPAFGADLNVTSSLTIAPASGHQTYYVGGNISVASGATLTVRNTTIVFVEFVGNNGTLQAQLSHIYHFSDAGTVNLVNSSVTTLVQQIDPYPSLSMTVTGTFRITDGNLSFPGSIVVSGPSAVFWTWGARIQPNPDVQNLSLTPGDAALYNATRWAPSLEVENGARASLLDTVENGSYAQVLSNGTLPGLPVSSLLGSYVQTATSSPASLPFPATAGTSAAALALETTLPTVQSGWLAFDYTAASTGQSQGWSFNYLGVSYAIPAITFASTATSVKVPLPAVAVAAINGAGLPSYLVHLNSAGVLLDTGPTTQTVTITNITLSFVDWTFNMTVTGAGSTLTAADSTLDLNWGATPGLPGASYRPWNSTKLELTNGASAFLANVSTPYALPADFSHQSFVVPDATSQATFYRWLTVPIVASLDLPIYGAAATAFSSYGVSPSDNLTATALNTLSSADPDLAAYVTAWDQVVGAPGYGQSATDGNSSLLLASSTLTESTLPDGHYLGDYHVGIASVASGGGSQAWEFASVTPYPYGMVTNGSGAAAPDVASKVVFADYKVGLTIGTPTISDAVTPIANSTISVGQNLTVGEEVTNNGTGTVSSYSVGMLFHVAGNATPVSVGVPQKFGSLAPGQSHLVNFTWYVNESFIGAHPDGILGTFEATVSWNPGSGVATGTLNVTVVPPYVSFSATGRQATLAPGTSYSITTRLAYPGHGQALLNVSARGTSGVYFLESGRPLSAGNLSLTLPISTDIQPGTYTVDSSVYYEGRTVWSNITTAFVVENPAASSSTPFLDQTILGIPIWLLLVIVVAIVAGLLGFFLFVRQRAKGKVVECGECGAMIPEDATACSKCGAEFEVDRVRCSRCGSTIPGTSKVCPECAATLLGKEAEEKADPERQGYADFVERFRGEAKKSLGDSYSEAAFWDWWKRQSTYVPFGQWKLQQSQGSRAGMTAPKQTPKEPPATPPSARPPPRTPPARPPSAAAAAAPAPPIVVPDMPGGPAETVTEEAPSNDGMPPSGSAGMIVCPNCHKETSSAFLVCTFCGAVTQ